MKRKLEPFGQQASQHGHLLIVVGPDLTRSDGKDVVVVGADPCRTTRDGSGVQCLNRARSGPRHLFAFCRAKTRSQASVSIEGEHGVHRGLQLGVADPQDEIEPFIELSLEGRKPHRVLNWKRLRDAVSLVLRTAE